tara:strand:+ start:83 stop:358 length:276 start_codon:yes stop_codon:yes gene_type:complete
LTQTQGPLKIGLSIHTVKDGRVKKKKGKIINGAIALLAAIVGCVSVYYKSHKSASDIAECIIEETIENVLDLPDGMMDGRINLPDSGDMSD